MSTEQLQNQIGGKGIDAGLQAVLNDINSAFTGAVKQNFAAQASKAAAPAANQNEAVAPQVANVDFNSAMKAIAIPGKAGSLSTYTPPVA